MAAKPLLLKPEPIEHVTIENEVKFTKDTHNKIQKYLDWNYSLDSEKDFNFFLEGAVNFFLENDTEFQKHLRQKSKTSRRKPITKKQDQTININQNTDSAEYNNSNSSVINS